MITDNYKNNIMSSEVGVKSIDFGDELGVFLSEKERNYDIFRSPSAPPTVDDAVSAAAGGGGGGGKSEITEDELRCDPAYVNYYYSNANLNPRLPPPLSSKEDWRFSQRYGGGGGGGEGGGGLGGIGDRRKVMNQYNNDNNDDNYDFNNSVADEFSGSNGDFDNSLFAKRSSFKGGKMENSVNGGQSEWSGVGLPGLGLGLGLGSKQKSIAEIFQDDLNHSTSMSRMPSRPASRNAFDESILTSEAQLSPISSSDGLRNSGVDVHGITANHNTSLSPSLSYASALGGGSLSRSTTPDPQLIARAPSPRIPTAGSSNGPNSAAELAAAFSGMRVSVDSQYQRSDQQSLFNVHTDYNNNVQNNSHMNSIDYTPFHQLSGVATKGSYLNTGKGGVDQNYFLRSDGGPNSPSYFHSVGSPSSAIPSYSLSGHNINPAMASMMAGQLGNYSRGGHSARSGHRVSNLDPLYLHYISCGDYAAAAQLAAFGEPSVDLLALQKAYLSALLKSESARSYMGQSGGMNHGYYDNRAFGNHLMNSFLPNSPVGPGSPLRHERNTRLSSGMRGMPGNWRAEGGAFMEQSFGSSLLDEFKSNKTRSFELAEIANHVVEFSADQYGSRFIQQKLETATTEEKDMVFHEIMPQALSLMTDVFGNYVIQKFFEHGSPSQIKELADKLTGHVLTLSLQMYGCRVIQKAIEVVDLEQQKQMVVELDGHIMRCVRDQNGNHVIQKCIECIPEDAIQFIITTFYDQIVTLSTHPYGCRVIQRVLEHCHNPTTQRMVMDEVMNSVCMLAQDQYGNYVVQHVLEHGKPHERTAIISELTGKIVQMSQQKFASNVIEKCLAFGDTTERCNIVNEMLGSSEDNEPLQVMMKDQFANYVVQKVLETCDDNQLEFILSRIKNHLNALKKYTYGKHIVARVEKLVAAGERRISLQASYPAAPMA